MQHRAAAPLALPESMFSGRWVMSGSGAGRERRRTGWANMLRRGLYGLLLWISQPLNAMAAGDNPAAEAEPKARRATIDIRLQPAEGPGEMPGWRVGYSTVDPRIAPALSPLAERLRRQRWNFDRSLPNLRAGVGLDIDLPEAGNLHLNLLPPRSHVHNAAQGLRWQLSADDSGDTARIWSLGGTLDRVSSGDKPGETGEQRLTVTPQLVLDVDALAGMKGDARMMIQRAQWRDSQSGEDLGQVWQVNLRWRF